MNCVNGLSFLTRIIKGAKTEQNGNTTTKERADKINNQQSQKKKKNKEKSLENCIQKSLCIV